LIGHGHAGQGGRTNREGRLVIQKQRQHAHGRTSDVDWVEMYFRMIRRGDQRSPQRIRFGRWIAIGIGQPNRACDRKPELCHRCESRWEDDDLWFCGSSAIVDPRGVTIAAASADREELIQGDVSEDLVRSVRKRVQSLHHRRPDLYK
jgi:predicted amidohydrolase